MPTMKKGMKKSSKIEDLQSLLHIVSSAQLAVKTFTPQQRSEKNWITNSMSSCVVVKKHK